MLVENVITTFESKSEKRAKTLDIVVKVMAVILLLCYFMQLYAKYAIDVQQVTKDHDLIILILRWLSPVAVMLGFITPFYGTKHTRLITPVLCLILGVLNLVFYRDNMIAWGMGSSIYTAAEGYAYTPVRYIPFIIEQVIFILLGIYYLVYDIKQKEWKDAKPLWIILILVGAIFTCVYAYFPQNIARLYHFKLWDNVPLDFNIGHIILLVFSIAMPLILYFLCRNLPIQSKTCLLVCMAVSSIFNFFYCGLYDSHSFYWGNIPLHLCNLATVLLFLAFVFKLKSVFYFTYFVNVLGTIFAMLMPNYEEATFFSYDVIRFWMNHSYALVLPLLGVALGVFERPKMKNMLQAIVAFTVYFLVVAVANAVISNWCEVDYFFINSNFFFDKIGGLGSEIKNNYVWEFTVGGLTLRFYPLFHLMVWAIFVALMFVVWYIYDFFYHVSDAHFALHAKKVLMNEQNVNLKKLLNGRSLKEPLYEEDKGMIEIKHFTKVYSGSNAPSVRDLNLTIKDGEVYGFLGHNGAGKSTTIKSIVGIQSITDGQIIVDGFDVAKQPVEAKLKIGYVSDNHAVYEKLTGREYINYIADLYMVSEEDRNARIEKYVTMFKLNDAIDREIKSYSHGMKQKIVVIASLIHDPKIWILDEPLTGLDPTSAYQIKECMREHASRGNIVFFSSHVIEVVEKICTKICIIGHGELKCEYSLKELKEKGISLEELYLKYVTNADKN